MHHPKLEPKAPQGIVDTSTGVEDELAALEEHWATIIIWTILGGVFVLGLALGVVIGRSSL